MKIDLLTDRHLQQLTDHWPCLKAFCCDVFFCLGRSMQSVILWDFEYGYYQYFLLVNLIMLTPQDNYSSQQLLSCWVLVGHLLHSVFEHRDFLNTAISQGSVATRLRCGWIFSETLLQSCYQICTWQNFKCQSTLAKLQARVWWHPFLTHSVYTVCSEKKTSPFVFF